MLWCLLVSALRQPRTGMTVCRETLASVSCAERDLRVLYSAGVVLKVGMLLGKAKPV